MNIFTLVQLKFCSVEKCKSMDSKMKPLWLVMSNADTFGEDIYLMFKKGDGKYT